MQKKYLLVFALLFVPLSAFADNGRSGDAVNLGWLSIGAGITAMIPIFVAQKIRKSITIFSNGASTVQVTSTYKSILNLHIILSSTAFAAGMAHGLFLLKHLDYISLSLAITMSVLMVSGILLKFSQSRNLYLFNKLLHGQTALVILLVALIFLHIVIEF
ncbi:MAG: hypothetical protein K8Q89_06335 [Nitrosarchaeum sp.]|nr:hypothetical protein [Nitrosarchaeum sp.]